MEEGDLDSDFNPEQNMIIQKRIEAAAKKKAARAKKQEKKREKKVEKKAVEKAIKQQEKGAKRTMTLA